jgi:hypothetical protein
MKKISIIFVLLVALGMLPSQVFAAGSESSKTLLCGADTVTQCAYDSGCMRTTAREVNLPRFIKVDMKKKVISQVNVDKPRQAEIKFMDRQENRIILQGAENGRAWSMVIRETIGEMSATVSDDLLGFVIFGMCTPM